MKSLLSLMAAFALAAGCAIKSAVAVPVAVPKASPGHQIAQATTVAVATPAVTLRHLLYPPRDYEADASRRWPLVLFLHGAGERGTDLEKVTVHGPPKLVKAGRDFPFILVSPQCPDGDRWHPDSLVALLEELSRSLRVDPRRWYVTGLSMGGFGSWELATQYPERFAAVAPICGGGQTIDLLLGNKAAAKTLGVWAFHGGRDTVVVPAESERMVAAFKKAGNSDTKLTVYPEAGHDSWTAAYNDPALYDWLLQHTR